MSRKVEKDGLAISLEFTMLAGLIGIPLACAIVRGCVALVTIAFESLR